MQVHKKQPSSFARLAAVLSTAAMILVASAGLAMAQDNRTASASGVSVNDIQSVIGTSRLDMRRCVMGDELPTRVDIVVDFVIDLDGTVQGTTLVESNANEPVDACVLGVIESLLFPSPTDGRAFTVRYPMIFVTGN